MGKTIGDSCDVKYVPFTYGLVEKARKKPLSARVAIFPCFFWFETVFLGKYLTSWARSQLFSIYLSTLGVNPKTSTILLYCFDTAKKRVFEGFFKGIFGLACWFSHVRMLPKIVGVLGRLSNI